MIGKIVGKVDYVADDHVLVETEAGVAYEICCSAPSLRRIPAPGESVTLYTELVVREDLMQLYGFETRMEREWHRLLVSVQGVGAKASLGILGTLGLAGVARALAVGDANAVRAAPGVGPKLATRIVTELKGKAPDAVGPGGAETGGGSADESATVEIGAVEAEAVSALVNLGYDRGEAAAAVAEASTGTGEDATGDLIRKALQQLGQNL